MRHATGNFHILNGTHHLGFGFFECLSTFVRDDPGNLIVICLEQITQLEQVLHTVLDRSSAPGREGFTRRVCCTIHIRPAADGCLCNCLSCCRVDHIQAFVCS